MRYRRRSVSFAGQPFNFEKMGREKERGDVWAVSHRGEFIGTMTTSQDITTRDFDLRCAEWLAELLKAPPNGGRSRQ